MDPYCYTPVYSILDCFINDQFDFNRYMQYKATEYNEEQEQYNSSFFYSWYNNDSSFNDSRPRKKQKRNRSSKAHKLMILCSNGMERALRPEDTLWYLLYVKTPITDPILLSKFRNRFRIPYEHYLDLVNELTTTPIFS